MDDTRSLASRRTLLRYCGIGGAAALAGCLGGDGTPDDSELPGLFDLAGDGTDSFRNWLVAGNTREVQGREMLFIYNDYERASEQNWESMLSFRDNIASSFGSDTDAHRATILIGTPDGGRGFLHLGSFDKESAVEVMRANDREVTGEYGEYAVINGQMAIGDDAFVVTPDYEQYIDAKDGESTRLGEEDDDVSVLLDLIPPGVQITVARNPDVEDVTISGTAVREVGPDGSFDRLIRTFVFEDADSASTDRAREIASSGNFRESVTEEQHGRVAMIEYTA